MANSEDFLQFVADTFRRFGAIRIRKMFGGAGVYCDEAIFATVDDDAVYLKADAISRPIFEAAGLSPFVFDAKDGPKTMSYFRAPDDIFDDEAALMRWTALALDAAMRASAKKANR